MEKQATHWGPTKTYWSKYDVNTGLVDKKGRIASLSLTAPAEMPNMKGENVWDEDASWRGVGLSSAGKHYYKHLQIAMECGCMERDVPLQWLLKNLEHSGEDVSNAAHVVICNQPYKSSRFAELSDSEHERLNGKDLSHFVKFFWRWLPLGVYGDMLFSEVLLNTCNDRLAGEVDKAVKREQVLLSEESATQMTTAFKVEADLLHYVQAQWIYNNASRLKMLQYNSVAECVICLWQNWLLTSEMLRGLDYIGVLEVASTHLVLTGVVQMFHRFL